MSQPRGRPAAQAGKGAGVAGRLTIEDLARLAGVHKSTVSRALSETHPLAQSPRGRQIRALAAEHGWAPDPLAAALRSGRTMTVGMVVPHLTDVVVARLVEAAEDACLARGFTLLAVTTRDTDERQVSALEALRRRRVDGLLTTTTRLDQPADPPVGWGGVAAPVVQVLRRNPASSSPFVVGDDELGGYLATRHLLDLGHRRVVFISGPRWASTAAGRQAGYRRAMSEAGVGTRGLVVAGGAFDVESGRRGASRLLAASPRPTAVVTVDDHAALGVVNVALAQGMRIGEDLAVVGYNDTPLAAQLPVPLTSVAHPLEGIGRQAVELLVGLLAGQQPPSVTIAPQLQVRDSTTPVREPPGRRPAVRR